MSPDGGEWTLGELGRAISDVRQRIDQVDQKLERRYVSVDSFVALKEDVRDLRESLQWTRRALGLQVATLVGGLLLLVIAAALN